MWNIFACYFVGANFVSMEVARELCLRTIQNVVLSSSGPLLKLAARSLGVVIGTAGFSK